jgi:hypothetical protein
MVNNLREILDSLKGKGVCHCEGSRREPVAIPMLFCHCEASQREAVAMTKKWLPSYNVRLVVFPCQRKTGVAISFLRFLPYNSILKLFLMDKVQKIDKI